MNPNLKPEWRMEQEICSYDVDPHQQARLPAICRFMQEAAYLHAGHLGLGHSFLAANGMAWVLARQRIVIDHLPRWGDRIQIRTWPSGRDRLFFHRDFEITHDGARILRASNAWSLIDLERRERVHPDHYMRVEIPERDSVFDVRPIRLKGCGCTDGLILPVTYGDLDLNGHVNNTRYIEWIMNAFPLGHHETMIMTEIEINYLAEAIYGQSVSVCHEETGPLEFSHSIRSGDKELCRARSRFKNESTMGAQESDW